MQKDCKFLMVGNHINKKSQIKVSRSEAQKFGLDNGFTYVSYGEIEKKETSVK